MTTLTSPVQTLASALQTNRFLKLSFPQDDAPADGLFASSFEGTESLSRDFHFTVEILSHDAYLQPRDFIGRQLCVQLLRNDGSYRHFSGYIFIFRYVKTNGGIATYEAHLGPWLKYLTWRQNSRLFLEQNLYEQTDEVLREYGVVTAWDWDTTNFPDEKITMACQFGEHDHNYLHRRWEEAGLLYRYEHTAKAHKLVLTNVSTTLPPIDGISPEIRFQSAAGSMEDDGISRWSKRQQVTATDVCFSHFDFKSPTPQTAGTQILDRNPILPDLEYHEYAGAYGFKNSRDGDRLAILRMEEIEATVEQFEGEGNCRYAMPGRWFRLADYFGLSRLTKPGDNEFLIVSVHHKATNNYLQNTGTPSEYHNEIRCIRRKVAWRPGRGYNSVDTRILAPQTATVVGSETSGSIHTDEFGRCLVQFHWDRAGKYSTWIRVASNWAGGAQGLVALPRIGSEVIVQWLDGNPDRPIITGRVPNAANLPSWQLPGQSALMGIRSRELDGKHGNGSNGRSNHLVFDDTAGRIQAQLRSDHENTQLSLGYVTRIETTQGRADARGEGFELRTDAVGAIRSGKGMLISTEIRPAAASHLSDISEPVGRLTQAQTLHNQLAKFATKADAQESTDQATTASTLQEQASAIKGGTRAGDSFPELEAAHLVLAGAAGIEATTPETAHITGGKDVAVTAASHISMVGGKSIFASAFEKISLFAYRMGLKLIAASGKVEIQAQNDDLELLAKKVVSLISTTDWINLTAKQGIRLTAGNSQFVISADGIQGFTPGANIIHAASHSTMGPKTIPAQFPGSDICASATTGASQAGNASVALD